MDSRQMLLRWMGSGSRLGALPMGEGVGWVMVGFYCPRVHGKLPVLVPYAQNLIS